MSLNQRGPIAPISLLVTLTLVSLVCVTAVAVVAAEPEARVDANEAELTNVDSSDESADKPAASLGMSRRDALIASLTIFVLSIFVGFEVITKVPPTLHTPLMSGSNAISGITLVGAVLVAGGSHGFAAFLGMFAVALAAINVVGGFMVTDRMLAMFRVKKD